MLLTRAGWLALAGAAGAFVVGRVFGLVELYLVAASILALVTIAVTRVALTRLRLDVTRTVTPRRIVAGQTARVELAVSNTADRPTPVLRLHDPVTGTQGATVLLAPVEEGLVVRSAYRLPTERRGLVAIGPLGIAVGDPFGLAQLRVDGAPRTEIVVLPRIDDVAPVPLAGGDEPLDGVLQVSLAPSGGDDFSALRDYVEGDDLRRIHWPSSARHGHLLVREDEVHWQGRTTIVLDTRSHTHTAEGFEVAVSAAASLLAAGWQRRDVVRLVTTAGWDSGDVTEGAAVEYLMEVLATVATDQGGSLRGVMESVATGGATSMVVVVGTVAEPELRSVLTAGAAVGWSTVVATGTAIAAPGVVALDGRPFAETWNHAVLLDTSPRRRAGAPT